MLTLVTNEILLFVYLPILFFATKHFPLIVVLVTKVVIEKAIFPSLQRFVSL